MWREISVSSLARVENSTVQYSAVQYSIVQYSTVQYSTVPGEGGEHRVELLEAAGRGRAAAARGEAGHDRVDGGHGAQPPLRHTGPLSAEKPEQFSDI